jgi:hypothetical protein
MFAGSGETLENMNTLPKILVFLAHKYLVTLH